MNFLKTVIAGIFLIAATLTATAGSELPEITSVQLETSSGKCSGVHIGNGRVLTAAHCFVPSFKKVKELNVKVGEYTGRVTWIDRIHDAAEVKIDDYLLVKSARPSLPVAYIECNAPSIGDKLRHEGFPGATGFIITNGEVISNLTSVGSRWPVSFFHDAIAGPGSSGGPLFNDSGKVVALLVGGSPQPPLVSVGVPLSAFCHRIARGY